MIKKLTHRGIPEGISIVERKRIIVINMILLVAIAVAVTRLVAFTYLEIWTNVIISTFSTILFFTALRLNYAKHHTAAKIILILTGNTAVIAADLKLGGLTGIHLLFLAAIAVNFYLFSLKEKRNIILASIFPIIGIFVVTLAPDLITTEAVMTDSAQKWSYFIGYVTATFLVVMISYHFVSTSTNIENELEATNNDLEDSLIEIREQQEIITSQNIEIKESLNYAKIIQRSTLPKEGDLNRYFKDHFVVFRPKEIVSGDFYWADFEGDTIYFAVADCTGHATPGAMLSMLGTQILNNAINVEHIQEPNKILEYLNQKMKKTLQVSEQSIHDGLELALISYNKVTKRLKFAGAGLPLYYTNDGSELKTLEKTGKGIGHVFQDTNESYDQHEIDLNENSELFLFTDGLKDQNTFEGKKMGIKKFRTNISDSLSISFNQKQKFFDDLTDNTLRGINQRDDITLVGLKV